MSIVFFLYFSYSSSFIVIFATNFTLAQSVIISFNFLSMLSLIFRYLSFKIIHTEMHIEFLFLTYVLINILVNILVLHIKLFHYCHWIKLLSVIFFFRFLMILSTKFFIVLYTTYILIALTKIYMFILYFN